MAESIKINYFFVPIVFFAFLLLGCTMIAQAVNQPIKRIVYSFSDASVPPQYHRSFTITVTQDQVHIVVDSYGDVIADKTLAIPGGVIDGLARSIKTNQIKEKESRSGTTVCAGGTSKTLTVYSDKSILLNGTVYQCGGCLEGSLSGDLDSLCKRMEDLIPDFTNLLK